MDGLWGSGLEQPLDPLKLLRGNDGREGVLDAHYGCALCPSRGLAPDERAGVNLIGQQDDGWSRLDANLLALEGPRDALGVEGLGRRP